MKKCKDCAYCEDYNKADKTFYCSKQDEWGSEYEQENEDASIMCEDFIQRNCDVCQHADLCYTKNMIAWANKAKVKITIDAQKCVYFKMEANHD